MQRAGRQAVGLSGGWQILFVLSGACTFLMLATLLKVTIIVRDTFCARQLSTHLQVLTHSLFGTIHPSIQQMFIECLLCARHVPGVGLQP